MASGDAKPMPQKNVAYRVTFPIFDATGSLVTGATSLDSEVSKDGGTFADCTNEATEIATSSGMYYLELTSTEMNADTVAIIVKSGNGKTTPIILYPEEAGDVRVNVTQISGDGTAADNAEAFFDGTGYAGTNNVIPLVTTTTTATNLTNAPTAGDLTATMKTSVTTAATAATPTATVSGDLSATMKTSVQTAATASLNAYDPPTRAELTSDVSALATATNLTTLTGKVDVIDGIVDSILVDTAEIGAAGAGLTAVPWNAAWDAEVQSEATDALNAYDPPTNAEMVARTLVAADYATATNLATVDTVVDSIATALATVDGLVDTLITQLTTNRSEPSPGAPPASATLGQKVDWLYVALRNKQEVTSSDHTYYADDGTTPLTDATVSDDGTTFTRGEMSAP